MAYATAKAGLNRLTRHLAAELAGSGVTANVVHPGDVKTAMWADIRDRAGALGAEGESHRQWVDWVEETGGDPPRKAVELVLRILDDDVNAPSSDRRPLVAYPSGGPGTVPALARQLTLAPSRMSICGEPANFVPVRGSAIASAAVQTPVSARDRRVKCDAQVDERCFHL